MHYGTKRMFEKRCDDCGYREVTMEITVALDRVPGEFHDATQAHHSVKAMLDQRIPHYLRSVYLTQA